jgi:S-adenosylmethionine synthetase
MKVLVTGSTGLLGRSVFAECSTDKDICVIGTGLGRAKPPIVPLDLLDVDALTSFLKTELPQVIIHCAAERRPDVAARDVDRTRRLNIDLCRLLAELSNELSFRLIYISTDYVFDGSNPPYKPNDAPNPLNIYGETKLEGEIEVKRAKNHLILRVPVLYGKVEYLEESAVNVLVKLVQEQKQTKVDDFLPRYPTNVEDVAKVIKQLCTNPAIGIYHFSAKEKFTKYQMCKVLSDIFGLPLTCIPTKEQSGEKRPFDCLLDTSDLQYIGIHTRFTAFKSFFASNLKTISR